MPDALIKPETPTMTIDNHEEYRKARERVGQIEGAHPGSPQGLELAGLNAAIQTYEQRLRSKRD